MAFYFIYVLHNGPPVGPPIMGGGIGIHILIHISITQTYTYTSVGVHTHRYVHIRIVELAQLDILDVIFFQTTSHYLNSAESWEVTVFLSIQC